MVFVQRPGIRHPRRRTPPVSDADFFPILRDDTLGGGQQVKVFIEYRCAGLAKGSLEHGSATGPLETLPGRLIV
jgi:hypothetical protein